MLYRFIYTYKVSLRGIWSHVKKNAEIKEGNATEPIFQMSEIKRLLEASIYRLPSKWTNFETVDILYCSSVAVLNKKRFDRPSAERDVT